MVHTAAVSVKNLKVETKRIFLNCLGGGYRFCEEQFRLFCFFSKVVSSSTYKANNLVEIPNVNSDLSRHTLDIKVTTNFPFEGGLVTRK